MAFKFVFTFLLALLPLLVGANRCDNPQIRKEWRTLSWSEQKAYMDAIKCLASLPHDNNLKPLVPLNTSQIPLVNPNSSYYDDFVYIHMDLNPIIHFTGLFVPWHRLYVRSLEQAMQDKCNFSGTQPYWDWTQDSKDLEHSNMFNPDPDVGFGGWGDPNNDFQISTGALADLVRAYPVSNHIRRNFTLQPWQYILSPFPDNQSFIDPMTMANTTFTPENAQYLTNNFPGDFLNWHFYMEGAPGPHGGIHEILGADMIGTCPSNAPSTCIGGPKWTPNDPLFFMHHAMVDKMWYDWQYKRPENFWSYSGGSIPTLATNEPVTYADYMEFRNGKPPLTNYSTVLPGDGIFPDRTIFEMMDTMAGPLCYKYE